MYLSDQPNIKDMEEPIENSLLPVKYYLQIKELQKRQVISECLSILISQSEQIDMTILRILENQGLSLGNGAFALARISFAELFFPFMKIEDGIPIPDREKRPKQQQASAMHIQIQQAFSGLCKTVFFSHGGDMYILLCLQGENNEDPEHYAGFFAELEQTIAQVCRYGNTHNIPIRFYISNIHLTVRHIAEAYQETCLLKEYASYLPAPSNLLLWSYHNGGKTERTLQSQKEQLMSQIAVALQLGQQESINLCIQNITQFLVGAYPASREIIQYKTGLFLWDLGQVLLEYTVVDAKFLQRYDFQALGKQCMDRRSLIQTLNTVVSEVQLCYQTLSARLTTNLLLNVQQYLDSNLRDPNLSVTAAADHFHVNRTTLSTRFQQFFGTSMTQYIQANRVALAKTLLKDNPKLSLEAVASQSGFCAVSTMYRVFMRLEGTSPGNFRSK